MDDYILISHDMMHTLKKQRSGTKFLAALKIDMNKADDRISWLFILKILNAYGFPPHWVQLINHAYLRSPIKLWLMGRPRNILNQNVGYVRVILCHQTYSYFLWIYCHK